MAKGRDSAGRFAAGNSGRPRGARHKSTIAAEALLEGEAKKLTRKAVELALAGDISALRLCLERVVAPRRDRPIAFALPPVTGAEDHPRALAAIMDGVARGELTPMDAQALSAVLEHHRKALETVDLEARVRVLEDRK